MSVKVSQSASVTVNGITPVAGAGLTLLASPALSTTNVSYGDYFAEIFTINASTPTTAKSLGDIVTGKVIWVQTDQPITVTLTQNAIDKDFAIDSFMHLNATFTAVKFANASATNAANINIVVAGDRVVNPGTPGIW